jgi:hypothetical protein
MHCAETLRNSRQSQSFLIARTSKARSKNLSYNSFNQFFQQCGEAPKSGAIVTDLRILVPRLYPRHAD